VPSPIARTYISLAAFYASDPARRRSRERDIGLWWRSKRGPTYRAAWVQDTGELYLVQHGLTGHGGGSVHLLGEPLSLDEVERRLDGWKDVVGTPGSFEWLQARVMGSGGRTAWSPPVTASAPRASARTPAESGRAA